MVSFKSHIVTMKIPITTGGGSMVSPRASPRLGAAVTLASLGALGVSRKNGPRKANW